MWDDQAHVNIFLTETEQEGRPLVIFLIYDRKWYVQGYKVIWTFPGKIS